MKDEVWLDELVEKLVECEAVRTEEGGIEIVFYGEENNEYTATNILIEEVEKYPEGKDEGESPLKRLIEELEELIE